MFFVFLLIQNVSNKSFYYIIILLGFSLMLGSGARSAMFAGILAIITYIFWSYISKNTFRFIFYFLIVIVGLMLFIFVYPQLPYWEHFPYFENLMLQYTGKSIMSGRDDVWRPVIIAINEQPWFGYGPGTLPIDVTGIDLSTHNLYLQIALQNGYLGLFVFIILLLYFWMIFYRNLKNKTVRLVASFFIAILIHQSFEIALTQNQLSIGLMQWFIISVGISQVMYLNEKHIP
ncbi:O-antigen ligase family protein [Rossellomorea aquimaris]|uniref:O-antigen ligase family protein n=1 Tax=Rossellomorea aquimaris TaxID=189382 RepID=UPI002495176C|nr:O-antigen ligase family protein [Rossellomorea aquimaris]